MRFTGEVDMAELLPCVPVTMGSPEYRTLEVDGFTVVEARFPPGEVLPRHVHERTIFSVMLEGSFDLSFTSLSYSCPPTTVSTEPAGEAHSNRIGRAGARVLVLQPDPRRTELVRPFAGILESVQHFQHAGIAAAAARLVREIASPDDVAPLAAEAAALEMLVAAQRLDGGSRGDRRPPRWLLRAQELVHSRFTDSLHLADVASAAGVHPAHLARAFRAHFRMPLGTYVRRLRLEWAAAELARNDRPLAALALAAGFADQSHFTRAFKRHTGLSPGRYRRNLAERRIPRGSR